MRVEGDAAETAPAARVVRTNAPVGRNTFAGATLETLRALLAGAVLRLQRVEREEKEREDELHALQSGETRIRRTSEGVALELSSVLFDRRKRIVRAESGVEAERVQEEAEIVKMKTVVAF